MNRFRTKKKSKEEPSAGLVRSSTEEAHSFMGFRRSKKSHEEEKIELDLSNALPSSDDFRTSLLMTGLSARFSMLREQDDPNSKIGKASDDSVLFPKRQSRLMDLGFRGLDDIAEVESLRAPLPYLRTNSFGSDTGSTSGSVLTRSRPTEGNNLFGGRQKIYRINTAATPKNASEGGMGGRALYENDVALSAFQKLRLREKEERFVDDEDENDEDRAGVSKEASDRLTSIPRSDSPSPVDFNLRRETSSTASSVGRNSTAATSVASQPAVSSKDWHTTSSQTQQSLLNNSGSAATSAPTIERTTTTRTRRLYEQGLNQDLHEHQSSALSRFDTLTGKRPLAAKLTETLTSSASSPAVAFGRSDRFGPPSGTVASALERLDRQQARPKMTSPEVRAISPPVTRTMAGSPAATATAQESNTPNAPPASSLDARPVPQSSPPLGSPVSELGEQQLFSIRPNDLGKATALGMFQKPNLPYDESRFAQRQLQRQQGRETPTERIISESDEFQSTGRSSRSSSTTRRPERPAPLPPTTEKAASLTSPGSVAAARKTFLFDDDDDDDSLPSIQHQSSWNTLDSQTVRERPSDADHPAFRQATTPGPPVQDIPPREENGVSEQAKPAPSSAEESARDGPVDSPTLGPGGPGLTGMVLQHLRSSSNASSVYSVESSRAPASRGNTQATHAGTATNPWDGDNWTASIYSALDGAPSENAPSADAQEDTQSPVATARPPIPDAHRAAMATDAAGNASKPPSVRSESSRSRLPSASVAGSARSSHNLDRDDDVDDFANQLANARKRVQERLTTYVESDSSRNTSPLLAPTESPTLPLPSKTNPLGILRAKSSRGSLMERPRDVSQPKALRILGLGSSTTSALPSPSKQVFEEVSSSAHAAPAPPVPTAAPPVPALPAARKVSDPSSTGPGAPEAGDKEKEREERSATPRSSPPRPSTDAAGRQGGGAEAEGDSPNAGGAGVHPGLQAFRNARRQLQRQKVLETQARHQGNQGNVRPDDEAPGVRPSQAATEPAEQQVPPTQERRGTVTRDRGPPPVHYQRRDPSQESSGGRSRSNSRTSAQTERERSGSDGSNSGGYTRHVPPRLRPNHAAGPPQDEYQPSGGHLGPPRANMPARSPGIPGLPGTDIRRSPHMPPTGIPGSGPSLSVQTAMARRSPASGGYGPPSNQPSPISPLGSAGLPAAPYYSGSTNASGPSTPSVVGGGQRTPYGPGANMPSSTLNGAGTKKPVNKNEISEPTFITSTSRVPTMSLPSGDFAPGAVGESSGNSGSGSRSRSGSRTRAGSNAAPGGVVPPLPPINPMRKQPTTRGPRGIFNGMLGRRGDGGDGGELASTASTPNLAFAAAAVSSPGYYQASPGDSEMPRFDAPPRPLRRQASEATGMHARAMGAGQPDHRMDMDIPGGMI